MNSINGENTSSNSSDIDICNTSPKYILKKTEYDQRKITDRNVFHCSISARRSVAIATSTPRVNFRSIESLAISSLNTSSLTPNSSPFSFQRHGK